MTQSTYELTIAKLQHLPEPLLEEVGDFIDFLLMRHDVAQWEKWNHFVETMNMAEADVTDYLSNLEDYEDRLARGEIRW